MTIGGFELCSRSGWKFTEPTSGNPYYDDNVDPINTTLSAIVTDDVHSGEHALRLVFKFDGGVVGYETSSSKALCVERTYAWSFWSKQGSANACTVDYTMGVKRGSVVPAVGVWTKYEGQFTISPVGPLETGGTVKLKFSCTGGDSLDYAVWVDDVSFTQVGTPYPQ